MILRKKIKKSQYREILTVAYKEIEQELVLDFGAPEYANNLGEFVTKEEYQEVYEVFQNELGNLFGGEGFSWRETTFQEN